MADMISGISDYYSKYSNQDAQTEKLKSKISGTDYSEATPDELMDVCKQFEAYFVEQVVKSMEKMVPDSDIKENSYMKMFGDNLTQEIASTISDNSELGLAQMLYEQMKRNYNIEEQ